MKNSHPAISYRAQCRLPILLSTAFLGFAATQSNAATITWNGADLATNNNWQNGGNWEGGVAPANSDFTDDVVFNAGPTTVNLSGNRSIDDVAFLTSGWNITGSTFTNIGKLSSAGAGTNTFSGGTLNVQSNQTYVIASTNTLLITPTLYLKGNTVTLNQTGTLQLNSAIGGFGSGTFGINIGVGTLQVGSAGIFEGTVSSNATIRFTDAGGVFRLAGSTTNAQGQIDAGRILNNTGGGSFQIDDFGGGFSQISIVPEPSTNLLLGSLGALALLLRRRN